MKIIAFSDWRLFRTFHISDFIQRCEPNIDLIVYAGDDLENIGKNGFEELAKLTKFKSVLAVAGNDDTINQKRHLKGKGVYDLYENVKIIKKYAFLGNEGSTLGPGFLKHTEVEVKKHLLEQNNKTSGKTKILVTHTPPFGILDVGIRFGIKPCGSKSVKKYIDTEKPLLVICGHVHSQGGKIQKSGDSTILNIASGDNQGDHPICALIEIENEKIIQIKIIDIFKPKEYCNLLYLPQVSYSRLERLRKIGITKLEELTDERREELMKFPGASKWLIDRWYLARDSALTNSISVMPDNEYSVLKREIIAYDIETTLEAPTGFPTLVFLIGCYDITSKKYFCFFEKKNEKRLLERFSDWLKLKNNLQLVSFSGSRFDQRHLIQAFTRNRLAVPVQINSEFDLGITIQKTVYGKLDGYKVTDIGKLFGYTIKKSDISGFDVGLLYSHYIKSGKEPNWNKIKEKCENDVMLLVKMIKEIKKRMGYSNNE